MRERNVEVNWNREEYRVGRVVCQRNKEVPVDKDFAFSPGVARNLETVAKAVMMKEPVLLVG